MAVEFKLMERNMKNIINYIIMLVLGVFIGYKYEQINFTKQLTLLETNKELVKKSFDIFDDSNVEESVAKYHDKSYVQLADGNKLDYNDLVAHVKALKNSISGKVDIEFHDIIAEGDTVCTVHKAKAKKNSGETVEIKVIALHKIKDGKIVLTDELTYVEKGASEDAVLGGTLQ